MQCAHPQLAPINRSSKVIAEKLKCVQEALAQHSIRSVTICGSCFLLAMVQPLQREATPHLAIHLSAIAVIKQRTKTNSTKNDDAPPVKRWRTGGLK